MSRQYEVPKGETQGEGLGPSVGPGKHQRHLSNTSRNEEDLKAIDVPVEETAVEVDELGGRNKVKTPRVDSKSDLHVASRLLVVSNKIKNTNIMQVAVWPNIIFLLYRFDSSTLDSLSGN